MKVYISAWFRLNPLSVVLVPAWGKTVPILLMMFLSTKAVVTNQ